MTPPATIIQESGKSEGPECTSEVPQQVGADVLPLQLTPFERYMTVDDRASYPMTYVTALELEGTVSRRALESAVAALRVRHPLLGARIRGSGRSASWQSVGEEIPHVIWRDEPPTPRAFEQQNIDLAIEAGLRVEAYSQDGRTHILFSFHHAMCDGKGASQLIGDVLAAYGIATSTSDEQPRMLPTQVDLLAQRGELSIPLPAPVSRWQAIRGFLTETWKLLSRRPSPLSANSTSSVRDQENLGMVTASVRQTTNRQLSQQAAVQGVTGNDILIRDLFCTVRDWNEDSQPGSVKRWIRMTIPINLRSRRDLKLPAANVLGYAFLTRRESECDLSQSFLLGLASDMRAVSKWGLGAMFLGAVRAIDRIPGGLFAVTRLSRSFSTVVLSNVGDPTRRFRAVFPRDERQRLIAGDLALESITTAPPVRPGTRVAIAVTTYRDRIAFGAQYEHSHLTVEQARRFLDLYVSRVEESSQNSNE